MHGHVEAERPTTLAQTAPSVAPEAVADRLPATLSTPAARALAVAVTLSCFTVAAVVWGLASGLLADVVDSETGETILGVVGLGSLVVGTIIGMRTAGLSRVRAWILVTVCSWLALAVLVGVGAALGATAAHPWLGELPYYTVLGGTFIWLMRRQAQPVAGRVLVIAAGVIGGAAMLLQIFDARGGVWLLPGVTVAAVVAALTAWGVAAQRSASTRRWPIVFVGLAGGLVAGLAILQASWTEARWPHRRRLSDAGAISIAAVLVVLAMWTASAPPFGLGPDVAPGRIERPALGYALTLPEPWRIEDVSATREFAGQELPAETAIDLMAARSDGGGFLVVSSVDYGFEIRPGALAGVIRLGLMSDPEYSGLSSEELELPAGQAARVDGRYLDHTSMSIYLIAHEDAGHHMLQFLSDEPPADRWLSVVETFEQLPG